MSTQAVRFTNEVVRPMSEKIRAIAAEAQSAKDTYQIDIADEISKIGSEVIDDGRESEGISRLTGSDIQQFMEALDYILAVDAKMTTIQKACVRPLTAS